jgi:endoglucanase
MGLLLAASFAACGSGGSDSSLAGSGEPELTVSAAGTGIGTVQSTPPGIQCGADCSEVYLPDTTVTLTATPVAGSLFGGWFGSDCSGTGPCTLTMSAAKAVSAIFDTVGSGGGGLPGIGVTVAVTGSGTVTSSVGGVTCGPGATSCDAAMAADTATTLTATPAAGQRFIGWGVRAQAPPLAA